jgi:death-on-curing protein
VNYLTQEEILFINHSWIDIFGGIYLEGSNNIRNDNSFNFLLDAPKQKIFGIETYRSTFQKAATYPFFIIKDHIFSDGNKRTGMVAAFLFLSKNGFRILENIKSKRISNYAERIASCRPNIDNIARWLRSISIQI